MVSFTAFHMCKQDAILALTPADIITPVPLEHWDVELLTQVGHQLTT